MTKKTVPGVTLNGIMMPVFERIYLCLSCRRRFTRKIEFLEVRCPHCGSFSAIPDPTIVY